MVNDHHGMCLMIQNKNAQAKISLFGAHVLSFTPADDNRERLWLSNKAVFDGRTPIRGGIPICWPWFAAYSSSQFAHPLQEKSLPSHGFARTQYWQLVDVSEMRSGDIVESSTLVFEPTELALHGVSKHLCVKLKVEISSTLRLDLITTNKGQEPLEITQALHSYFKVPNIKSIQVTGIEEDYDDKPTQTSDNKTAKPYTIQGEVDRIHRRTKNDTLSRQTAAIICKKLGNIVDITNIEHDSVVVWNPWSEKSQQMIDMTDTGYASMLCIEAANTKPRCIDANASVTLSQVIQ